MLTDDQYRILRSFADDPNDWKPAPSPIDAPAFHVLLNLKAISDYPEIHVLQQGKPYQEQPIDWAPNLYCFNPDVGNTLLQDFEQHAKDVAKQANVKAEEKWLAAKERQLDRRINIILPFVTLFIGWLLGLLTPK